MLNIEQYLNKVRPFIEKDIQGVLDQLLNKKSNLSKDLKVDSSSTGLSILLSDYVKYIESGRKAKAKKIPIRVLLKWGKDSGLGTLSNNEVYAIQQSIFNRGIKGRPGFINRLGERIDDVFDSLYNKVVSPELEKDLDLDITKKLNDNGFRNK